MVVLIAVAAIGLAACYSPSLRDCSITCSNTNECAQGQVCGNAGYCAAPEVADRCADVISDAGMTPVDATPVDAAPRVTLHLHVDGPGEIDFGANPCRTDCMYSVPIHAQITLTAVDINDHEFDKWTMGPCTGQTTRTCEFSIAAATTVNGKWH